MGNANVFVLPQNDDVILLLNSWSYVFVKKRSTLRPSKCCAKKLGNTFFDVDIATKSKSYVVYNGMNWVECNLIWNHNGWFQTKITRPAVQLPLWNRTIKFIQFVLTTKVAKFAKQWLFRLSFSCNVIGLFKKTLKSDWLFCFNVPFSLDEEQKMVRFRNKLHCWEPIRLQGSPVISKWIL